MRLRSSAITILIITAALLVTGCGSGTAPASPTSTPTAAAGSEAITAEGRLEPVHYVNLSLSADGSISEINAQEGQAVEQGQVLVRVQNSQALTLEAAQAEQASKLADAYQAVRDAQHALDDCDIPSKYASMAPAEAARVALAELNAARDAFEPYKNLSRKSLRPNYGWKAFPGLPGRIVADTEVYTGLAREYEKRLDSVWVDYRKTVEWLNRASALETAQAQLVQAQKDFDSLQDASFAENTAGARAALANAELRAPFAGTVTNLDLKVGQFAASGTSVATIADFSSWVVKTTDLTEIDVVNIKEGQPVTLTLDAIPDVNLKGYVQSIGQNYSEKQGDIVYQVTVLLTDQNPAMRWGMTAQVKFAE